MAWAKVHLNQGEIVQLSANQLKASVSEVKSGAVNSEIIAKIGEQELRAIITNESAKSPNLSSGKEIYFIFKASSVLIAKGDINISAANKIKGQISEIKPGALNSEVIVNVPYGCTKIAAIITNESVKSLDLKAGDEVIALIKASNILIGC